MRISDWSSDVCSSDLAELLDVGKREASAALGARLDVDRESPLDLTLAQCVSKGDRMDYTLQKAVELGVTRIVPLLSSRSVVRLDAERMDKKLEHWRGVIVSACEQSGRTLIPSLNEPAALLTWLRSEEHTSELQSLMRISYAVFCLKNKKI